MVKAKLRSGHFQEWQVTALDRLGHPSFGDGVRKVGWEKWQFLENWKFLQSLPVPLLSLFAVSCAEHVITTWTKQFPDDQRPPEAIQAAKDFLDGKITEEELREKEEAAWSAASAAGAAAESARAASRAAAAAAWAVEAAAWAALAVALRSNAAVVKAAEAARATSPSESEWQFQELTKMIISWVQED